MSAVFASFLIVAALSLGADTDSGEPGSVSMGANADTACVSTWPGRDSERHSLWLVVISFASGAALAGAGSTYRFGAACGRLSPIGAAAFDTRSEWRILSTDEDEVLTEHDAKGVIRFASASLMNLTRYPMRALVGRNGEDFVHEDDLQLLRRAVYAAHCSGRETSVLFRMRTSTGAYLWLDGTFHRTAMQTTEPRLMCVARPVALSA